MNLKESFKKYIDAESLFKKGDHLLIAVSGGVDSIVLCHLCREAGFPFSIAHCNFQLRNEESDGDEAFVKSFAGIIDVPVYIQKFDTVKYTEENKVSIQVAARELRYKWFFELVNKIKNEQSSSAFRIGGILTAHHADDNMETILMNFFKGSGINGLKGILPKKDLLMRPLLFAAKKDILQYARENNLAYREDSSNSIDKYTRNYFRNQLIPGLQKVFPQVKENLVRNASRFREINNIYDNAVEQAKRALMTKKGNEFHLPVLKLLKEPALKTILYEVIKPFGFSAAQTDEAMRLLTSSSGKYVQSASHRMLRNRKWLIISPLAEKDNSIYLLEENETEIVFPLGKLKIEKFSTLEKMDVSPLVAQLSAKALTYPLLIRKWKQGDYFYPLGMQKKKKLSRFFIDQKLSLNQKENTWVVESNKKIIWVTGMRIDDRFKLSDPKTPVLKLSILPAK